MRCGAQPPCSLARVGLRRRVRGARGLISAGLGSNWLGTLLPNRCVLMTPCCISNPRLGCCAGLGEIAMKQSREGTPLWVWLTFGVLGVGGLAYGAAYVMVEDILAFIR